MTIRTPEPQPRFPMDAHDDLRVRYERDGYLAPVEVFSAAEIDAIREGFDAIEAREGRAASQVGLHARHLEDRFIWDMVTDPRILDLVQALVGEDLVLLSSQFFCKYPGPREGRFVAWHQDVTYWGLEPATAHSAWIAVDDSDVENGCMQVIPGSHREGLAPHSTSARDGNLLSVNQEVSAAHVDASRAVALELRAGQVSLHHGMLLHASHPNTSSRRRCGLAVRYVPPHVRQVKANSRGRYWRTVVVRGVDRAGHHPAETPFPLPATRPTGATSRPA